MKSPDVALMALWTGQIDASTNVLKQMAIHEMTPAEIHIALQVITTISCHCDSIKKLITEASKS